MTNTQFNTFINSDFLSSIQPVYSFSRQLALLEGRLVNVSDTPEAKQARIEYPVAVTAAVWDAYIEWTDHDNNRQGYQEMAGRLWDVLWVLRSQMKKFFNHHTFLYSFCVLPRGGYGESTQLRQLKAVLHDDDYGNSVITIMMPNENKF